MIDSERYNRQIRLPEVGKEGQRRLREASILIIGMGGIGCPAALYLAGAGIGKLGLVDQDSISLSNLHRQILYRSNELGQSKLQIAQARLKALNPETKIILHEVYFSNENAAEILTGYDLILDGTDQFDAHLLINETCVAHSKPLIYGSVEKWKGQISFYIPKQSPCYQCLFPLPPSPQQAPSCDEAGVLGPVPGLIALLGATEALKFLLNQGRSLGGRTLIYNALDLTFQEFQVDSDPDCPICGVHPRRVKRESTVCNPELSAKQLLQDLLSDSFLKDTQIIDVRTAEEFHESKIPGAQLIPLNELAEKSHQLDRNKLTILYCKSGRRSATAIPILQGLGFTRLIQLRGGIDAFNKTLDSH